MLPDWTVLLVAMLGVLALALEAMHFHGRAKNAETRATLLGVQFEEMKVDRNYWRRRAERFLDHDLHRAGAIDGPVMEDRESPRTGANTHLAHTMRALTRRVTHAERPGAADEPGATVVGVLPRV